MSHWHDGKLLNALYRYSSRHVQSISSQKGCLAEVSTYRPMSLTFIPCVFDKTGDILLVCYAQKNCRFEIRCQFWIKILHASNKCSIEGQENAIDAQQKHLRPFHFTDWIFFWPHIFWWPLCYSILLQISPISLKLPLTPPFLISVKLIGSLFLAVYNLMTGLTFSSPMTPMNAFFFFCLDYLPLFSLTPLLDTLSPK